MGAGCKSLPRPSLIQTSLWSLSGSLVYAASQWGMVVALARLGPPSLVGRYALALAMAAPPLLLANLQLRTLVVTDVPARFPLASYWKLRATATAVALGVIAALVWATGMHAEAALETGLVALIKTIENLADLYDAVLQKYECATRIAVVWWAKGLCSLAGFVMALEATGRLWPALVAVALCHAMVLGVMERPAARLLAEALPDGAREPADRSTLRLARVAFPLGLVIFWIALLPAIPRYFIEWRQGAEALGYFAALSCFPLAAQSTLSAVGQAATARLAVCFRVNRRDFRRLTARLIWLAVATGVAAMASARWIPALLERLYRPDYAGHGELLMWLMAAGAVSGVAGMLGTALTAAHVIRPQPVLYALAVGVCLTYCYFLVGAKRPAAGAQALAAGALVLALGQGVLLARLNRR